MPPGRYRLIFYGSLILCNGYWILACFMGITSGGFMTWYVIFILF